VLFLVAKDGQQLGPFTLEEVNTQLAGGMLDPSDLGWTEGFEDWYPLEQIEEFVMPGEAGSEEVPETEYPMVTTVGQAAGAPDGAAPGLMTAGDAAVASSGGRKKWIGLSVAVVLLAGGAFMVFGMGSELDPFCQVKAKLHPKTGLLGSLEAQLQNVRAEVIKLSDGNQTLAEARLSEALKLLTNPVPKLPGNLEAQLSSVRAELNKLSDGNQTIAEARLSDALKLLMIPIPKPVPQTNKPSAKTDNNGTDGNKN
jgi:hypothetical protein